MGDQSSLIAVKERGVILRGSGHTLGLMHEHQHTGREGTITCGKRASASSLALTCPADQLSIVSCHQVMHEEPGLV